MYRTFSVCVVGFRNQRLKVRCVHNPSMWTDEKIRDDEYLGATVFQQSLNFFILLSEYFKSSFRLEKRIPNVECTTIRRDAD